MAIRSLSHASFSALNKAFKRLFNIAELAELLERGLVKLRIGDARRVYDPITERLKPLHQTRGLGGLLSREVILFTRIAIQIVERDLPLHSLFSPGLDGEFHLSLEDAADAIGLEEEGARGGKMPCERTPVERRIGFKTKLVISRRHDIEEAHSLLPDRASERRMADEHRHPHKLLIKPSPAMRDGAMIEELLAMIARKDEERVLEDAFARERLVDRAELTIVIAHLGVIERDEPLTVARA